MLKAEFGIVGLGRIGGALALQAREKDMRVVGFARSGLSSELENAGVVAAESIGRFRELLERPRVVLVYVPAGPTVDEVIDELAATLEPGDVIVDGGNSYWGDSVRRHERLKQQGVEFADLGTSGGVAGARQGACFMLGAEQGVAALVEPLLRKLAVEGGYVHAGPPGAGHFAKLVHNGIAFGMLQAIAEGMDLLEHFDDKLPIADVFHCWSHGSIVRGLLVELMEKEYRAQGGLNEVSPHVEDTGEVNWLVQDALQMERPIPVISQAVTQLLASRDKEQLWARAIAMMRHGFGGHALGDDESLRKRRQESRVGPIGRRSSRE